MRTIPYHLIACVSFKLLIKHPLSTLSPCKVPNILNKFGILLTWESETVLRHTAGKLMTRHQSRKIGCLLFLFHPSHTQFIFIMQALFYCCCFCPLRSRFRWVFIAPMGEFWERDLHGGKNSWRFGGKKRGRGEKQWAQKFHRDSD